MFICVCFCPPLVLCVSVCLCLCVVIPKLKRATHSFYVEKENIKKCSKRENQYRTKSNPPPPKKNPKFYPFLHDLYKNQTDTSSSAYFSKTRRRKKTTPQKLLLLLLQNTITFQQHSLSLAPSLPQFLRPSHCFLLSIL